MAFQRRAIFVIVALVAILTALAVTSGAKAHYGNQWFTSARGMTDAIEGKYRLDVFKKCIVAGAQANVLKVGEFGAAEYDHYVCMVTTPASRVCWVTAHQTGGRWSDIVLTSQKGFGNYGGCGPSDIRRR